MARLSKSKLMSAHQCPKRLYLEVHHPELAEYSEQTLNIFNTGDVVGDYACREFSGGINIDELPSLTQKIEATRHYLDDNTNHILYEASFQHDDVLIKSDIVTQSTQGLDLYEVKSSASVKDHYYLDVAIQAHVIQKAGYTLNRTFLTHINSQFVYETENDYNGLFWHKDITAVLPKLDHSIPDLIQAAKTLLDGECPVIAVGTHCKKPYECPFLNHCSAPNELAYPVTSFPRGAKIAKQLQADGFWEISQIPDGVLTKPIYERIRKCVIDDKPYISPDAKSILHSLPYPRYYIDFETIGFAIPIWLGTRPFQQLPFQWSCHIEYQDGSLEHKEFLDISGQPPMQGFIENLITVAGDDGVVIVYNASFEKRILRELAAQFPDTSKKVNNIIERMFDLLPFTQKNYYHKDMHGSWSLKSVLPTIVPELNYDTLDSVHHGGEAQEAYLECIQPDTPSKRKALLAQGLKEYCALDTLAMFKIIEKLS